ncbi:hypothetical protein [Stigmatella aurantiaca]|uniref:Conserved uncharacterized protein n=1 Tax=Stigmatella aurantiaca (strain DW4/3-1) TaxID=378806 RepID=Q093P6_STIAD|nr:hypothetical protein [Stigmatella aurantiaca]ADO71084.1 conserved uncharacterized protein [Stigmatella aurantiaca DW4/3-1]EAU66952.1 hypothetical protein STIAU_4646 [Stigmatella aurantiaca DW4/3-1]
MKPTASAGLFCELYWGTYLSEAWSFGPGQPQVHAAQDQKAPLQLYGFSLPEEPFLLAERTGPSYRIFVPPGAMLERSLPGGDFEPVPEAQLTRQQDRASVDLPEGTTLRLTQGQLHLYLQHSVAKDRVQGLRPRDMAWLALVILLFVSAPLSFIIAGPSPERIAESNARAIAAAREKEAERRKSLGVDTPLRPITETPAPGDGGTQLKVPASFSVQ